MKETLTVKREGKPVRCEVCHQTDLFDPQTGVCGRCSDVFSPEAIASRDVLQEFNIPEPFHSVFLNATQGERVLWAGRPVARLARELSPVHFLILLPAVALGVFGLWVGMPELLLFSAFLGLLCGLPVFSGLRSQRRIDHTLYVLTERFAMVLRKDRPGQSNVYKLGKQPPHSTLVSEEDDIGHVILFQEELTRSSLPTGAWDSFVKVGFMTEKHDCGFFFIENPGEVERLVRRQAFLRDEA
jgi:hypothetical protein